MAPPGAAGPVPPPMPMAGGAPGIRRHGGRSYAKGGAVKSGPTWGEGKRAGTQVQHQDGKDDGKGDKNKTGKASQVIPATDYPDVTGADMVWKQGITGKGVTVAVPAP